MNKNNLLSLILIPITLAAMVGLAFYLVAEPEMLTFKNEQYKLAFQYPETYALKEEVINTSHRYHIQQILTDAKWVQPENGEGPTAIIAGVYQNNLDKLTAEQWIKNNSASNYKLSDGKLMPVTLDGGEGFLYHWDGLYSAEQIVVTKGDNVYYFIVTYMDLVDQNIRDFQKILPTIDLD